MIEHQENSRSGKWLTTLLVFVLCLSLGFLANQLILLNGHDYGLVLTRLLDTHYAFILQGLSLHEYSPAFCGGVFNFANPNSSSLSLSQILVSGFGAELGIKFLFILVSLGGALGVFCCSRLAALPVSSALIAAGCFALSGIFVTKLVVGHLLFYHLMLAPVIAALLLKSIHELLLKKHVGAMVFACLAAAITSSSIYGGVAGFLLPFMASILITWLICGGMRERPMKSLGLFAAYLVLATALSAPKIEASIALFSNVGNRDFYSMPGFDLSGLVLYNLSSLFSVPDSDRINDLMLNAEWYMGWHEIYVGLPSIVGVSAVIWVLFRPSSLKVFGLSQFGLLGTIGIGITLLVPLLLNYHSSGWNQVIESLPILGDSSNMLRWSCVYVPAFALAMGLIFKDLDILVPKLTMAAIAMMVATTYWNYAVINENLVAKETFNPDEILSYWHDDADRISELKYVGLATDDDGNGRRRVIYAPQFDHLFTQGVSNATCYEPVFGYRLENFPLSSIRSGDISVLQNGTYGLINPACYVYPEENNCSPGDRFTARQKDQMLLFAQRKPFGAKVSRARELSNVLAAGLWLMILVLSFSYAGSGCSRLFPKRQRCSETLLTNALPLSVCKLHVAVFAVHHPSKVRRHFQHDVPKHCRNWCRQ